MTLPAHVAGLTLDAGALIQFEKGAELVRRLLESARQWSVPVATPAGVLAQVWRGRRQTRIAQLLASRPGKSKVDRWVEIVPLDEKAARRSGLLCGISGCSDVVDASVVLCARDRGHAVLTTDPDDLRGIDPSMVVIPV